MSSKRKVDELRAQLSARGLDTSGNKPSLGGEVYDAILNQTNVGENNNKFYVIQALGSDDGRTFMVYNRWGRVGVRGQDKLHGPYTSQERAINEFQMKFFDKTKNQWCHRKNFTCYPKCYTWLDMDYSETEKETVMQLTCAFLSHSFN